jgi:hypothetical protein
VRQVLGESVADGVECGLVNPGEGAEAEERGDGGLGELGAAALAPVPASADHPAMVKLSQNRAATDQGGVVDALDYKAAPGADAIADAMRTDARARV